MNRYWRVVPEPGHLLPNLPNTAERIGEALAKEYPTLGEAETTAAGLARSNPGRKYAVYEIVSTFIVNGLTRETPGDLKGVALDAVLDAQDAPHPPQWRQLQPNEHVRNGTLVRTRLPDPSITDWSPEARKRNAWGLEGIVIITHNSHGTCFEVRHVHDGSVGVYACSELEVENK